MQAKTPLTLAAGALILCAMLMASSDGAWAQAKPDTGGAAERGNLQAGQPQGTPAPEPEMQVPDEDEAPPSQGCPDLGRKLELLA